MGEIDGPPPPSIMPPASALTLKFHDPLGRSSCVGLCMRLRVGLAFTALAAASTLLLPASPAAAQYQPPSDKLQITARSAATWAATGEDVIQLEGPVTIETDRA